MVLPTTPDSSKPFVEDDNGRFLVSSSSITSLESKDNERERVVDELVFVTVRRDWLPVSNPSYPATSGTSLCMSLLCRLRLRPEIDALHSAHVTRSTGLHFVGPFASAIYKTIAFT